MIGMLTESACAPLRSDFRFEALQLGAEKVLSSGTAQAVRAILTLRKSKVSQLS